MVTLKTIPDLRPQWLPVYTHFQTKTAQKPGQTISFGAAHTYVAHIGEYPPGPTMQSPFGISNHPP